MDDDGWTVVQSKQYKQAVGKTKQAIKRIVGEKSVQESLTHIGKRKLEDEQSSEGSKKKLSGWGMWTFPESKEKSTATQNKKRALGESKPAARPTITLQKSKTPAAIDEDEQHEIVRAFSEKFPHTYRAITDTEAESVLKENDLRATPVQAQLIFKHHLRKKVALALSQIERSIPVVVELYDKKQRDILEISEKIDLPPVTVFRILLIGRKLSSEKIDQVLQTKERSKFVFLSERDNEQLQKARANDVITRELLDSTTQNSLFKGVVTTQTQERKKKKASEFEKKVEEKLLELGVQFVTEEDIRTKMGGIFATPDFVIEGGVKIAGKTVYWIDAKSYFGSDMDNVRIPLINQSSKYNDIFGPGAVVFALGYTQSLAAALDNVILVSASQLGISKK
eukprot:Phypoly_transcript_03733.p1 GENE.Phypoly_transcript_03733~~Phypoly_transcript_03733.p1  ORF type:complete len:395 (+),score=78.77 Phypoly_transcript_03733:1111-2295(+)